MPLEDVLITAPRGSVPNPLARPPDGPSADFGNSTARQNAALEARNARENAEKTAPVGRAIGAGLALPLVSLPTAILETLTPSPPLVNVLEELFVTAPKPPPPPSLASAIVSGASRVLSPLIGVLFPSQISREPTTTILGNPNRTLPGQAPAVQPVAPSPGWPYEFTPAPLEEIIITPGPRINTPGVPDTWIPNPLNPFSPKLPSTSVPRSPSPSGRTLPEAVPIPLPFALPFTPPFASPLPSSPPSTPPGPPFTLPTPSTPVYPLLPVDLPPDLLKPKPSTPARKPTSTVGKLDLSTGLSPEPTPVPQPELDVESCPKPKKPKPRTLCYVTLTHEKTDPTTDQPIRWRKIQCQ